MRQKSTRGAYWAGNLTKVVEHKNGGLADFAEMTHRRDRPELPLQDGPSAADQRQEVEAVSTTFPPQEPGRYSCQTALLPEVPESMASEAEYQQPRGSGDADYGEHHKDPCDAALDGKDGRPSATAKPM
jgi:hypothetical protein